MRKVDFAESIEFEVFIGCTVRQVVFITWCLTRQLKALNNAHYVCYFKRNTVFSLGRFTFWSELDQWQNIAVKFLAESEVIKRAN